MSSEQQTPAKIQVTKITPEAFDERVSTFGPVVPIHLQNFVFGMADRLMPSYSGGRWTFRELSNGGFYVVPPGESPIQVEWPGNYFSGMLSPDAAGIVTTLYALCALCENMSGHPKADDMIDAYQALRAFAVEHAEADLIGAAID